MISTTGWACCPTPTRFCRPVRRRRARRLLRIAFPARASGSLRGRRPRTAARPGGFGRPCMNATRPARLLDRAVTKRVHDFLGACRRTEDLALAGVGGRATDAVASVQSRSTKPPDALLFWAPSSQGSARSSRKRDPKQPPRSTSTNWSTESRRSGTASHPVVLIIDDLHELKSAVALSQRSTCSRSFPALRAWCCRRAGPDDQLHKLRLADEIARSGPRICASRTRNARAARCVGGQLVGRWDRRSV